jgi:hypothetical protein
MLQIYIFFFFLALTEFMWKYEIKSPNFALSLESRKWHSELTLRHGLEGLGGGERTMLDLNRLKTESSE